MSVLVTPAEMRAAEQSAIAAGRPEPDLMRTAAEMMMRWLLAASEDLELIAPESVTPPHAVALVGPGNNGGDALVTLGLLAQRGWSVSAILLGRSTFGELPIDPQLLSAIRIGGLDLLDTSSFILDGVFGIGSRETLASEYVEAFRSAAASRSRHGSILIAIDVPSGINAETGQASKDAFQADITLCLGLTKLGCVKEPASKHVGELVLLDIGIPEPAISANEQRPAVINDRMVRPLIPRRETSAHKSNAGTLLVVAGAPDYYGAPRFCSAAAMRVGAGLVALAAPSSIVPTIAGSVPEIVMIPLPDHPATAIEAIANFSVARASTLKAVVIGPGLGDSRFANDVMETLLGASIVPDALKATARLPHVIDADGLNWIARRGRWPEKLSPGSAVLTPHAGELARLLNVQVGQVLNDPWESARQAARDSGQIVVLKVGYTAVASPSGDVWLAPRAMPEMATAGTGDVLAGAIGGFLAQGLSPLDASRLAVYVGSQAGLAARHHFGTLSVIASDIIDAMPRVLARQSIPIVR